jgi:hypothetical protein
MHRHFCSIADHDWQCSDNCECICDLPMEGHDHSDCPVELRPCPDHIAEHEAQMAEVLSDDGSLPESALVEPQGPVPDCQCGCADIDASQIVGWCLWCNHVYSKWNLLIQDQHFASHCPGASAQSRQDAHAALAKRRMNES